MKKNILISSAGRRVSLLQAFKTELNKEFDDAKVFASDLNPQYSAACHVADSFFKVPKINDPKFIEEILSICKLNDIGLVVPTLDTELEIYSKNKALFLENGIHIIASDKEFIDVCNDKRKTKMFFEENNIPTPEIYDKQNIKFPAFLKPYDGSLSKDNYLIKNENEITEYHLNHPKLIYMQYIDHSKFSEFTVDMYYNKNNDLICAVPRKRIEVRGGEISKGITKKNQILELIKQKLQNIKGAIGCITTQFFLNEETSEIYGIEINPRFGGGYPLSYFSKANYPLYVIKEYLMDEKLEYFEDWIENRVMLRYDDQIIFDL